MWNWLRSIDVPKIYLLILHFSIPNPNSRSTQYKFLKKNMLDRIKDVSATPGCQGNFTIYYVTILSPFLVSFNLSPPQQSQKTYTISFYWTILLFVDLRQYFGCCINHFTLATCSLDIDFFIFSNVVPLHRNKILITKP